MLAHIVTEEDRRLSKRDPNIYRIGHYLCALADAEESADIVQGILSAFTYTRMRDKLLRAVGQIPCDHSRGNQCRLCT